MADTNPEWARGHDVGELKDKAAPFKAMHRPLAFGAYGSVREADVALAIDRGGYFSVGEQGQARAAAAIVRALDGTRSFVDFRGQEIAITGNAYVQAFACRDLACGIDLMQIIVDQLGRRLNDSDATGLVLELFEEDALAKLVAEAFHFKWQGSKIGAASEIKGIYAIGQQSLQLPPEERATLEILQPDFWNTDELALVSEELQAAGDRWEQHYSSYNKRQSWTAFALRGFSESASFIIKPAEMSRTWKAAHPELLSREPRMTGIAELFPETLRLIEQDIRPVAEFERIRFMRLAPGGGELTRHADITDRDAGIQDGKIARLHIPIRTSPHVTFFGWSERGQQIERHLPVGALCYLDQRKPHRVKNADPAAERIHLVLDVKAEHNLRHLVAGAMR